MITRTITIQTADGAQLLPVAELDFTNLVLAVMTGIPVREAGRLLTQHLGNGGSLEDIFGVFTEAMADAGFGNRPTPQDHKKPQTRKTTTKK